MVVTALACPHARRETLASMLGIVLAVAFVVAADPSVEDRIRAECQAENTRARGLDRHGADACVARRLPGAQEEAAKAEATKAESDRRYAEDQAARVAALAKQSAEVAEAEAQEAAEIDAKRKKCGKDFGRVEVGMKFSRVADCAGPLEVVEATATYKVYQGAGGFVWIQRGRVSRIRYTR